MPRYYFNIHDIHGDIILDDEGTDLPNLKAAKDEAENSAKVLLKIVIDHAGIVDDRSVEVMDSDGVSVTTVKLRDLIH